MEVPGVGWASSFQLGKGKTLRIPNSVHANSRQKVMAEMAKKGLCSGICLLKGGEDKNQYETDMELLFRQDSWFNYLFGVKEPQFYGALTLSTKSCTLFIPRLNSEYEIWCGKIQSPAYFQTLYGVDEVLYIDELEGWLVQAMKAEDHDPNTKDTTSSDGDGDAKKPSSMKIYLNKGRNSDSGLYAKPATFPGETSFREAGQVCEDTLFDVLTTARVTKSDQEIEAMWYASLIASQAHVAVMRSTRVGMCEYELEARFLYEIYATGGCRNAAYTSICACGPNGAVLHYGHAGAPNDRLLLANDMCLLDMGADYHGYVSDITCSFPLSDAFTADQKAIYEGVLSAQRVVLAHMLVDTWWPDCHRLAEKEILLALQGVGVIVKTASIEELVGADVGAVFFPHGLGHLIGCDTHDVGGYLTGSPERLMSPGLNKLRTARYLEAGMVLTNEPGCYFIDALLDLALANPAQAHYLDPVQLQRFRGFGGVRLEDVVVVRPGGLPPSNLTTCPRTVKEVEAVRAGGPWPPEKDEAPDLYRRWGKLSKDGAKMEHIVYGAMVKKDGGDSSS